MATYLKRAEGISVSHNFVAQVWRDYDLQPQRQGTFKLSSAAGTADRLAKTDVQ